MAYYTYYCEVKDRVREYPAGVYKVVTSNRSVGPWYPVLNRLITVSDWVWKQGPKGGVKIVKAPWPKMMPLGYVTSDKDYMQEFAWTKLRAQVIEN